MSLHVAILPEAEAELKKSACRDKVCALCVSCLCCALGGLTLYLTVKLFADAPSSMFLSDYWEAEEESGPLKQPEMVRPRPAADSPAPAASMELVLPETVSSVALPMVDVPAEDGRLGLSVDIGPGPGLDGIGFHAVHSTLIGDVIERRDDIESASALEGTFYDLKQTVSGAATGMSPALCKKMLGEFVNKGWNAGLLSRFYQAPTKLYASCFYLPICKAEEAPYAYGVEDRVQASMWVAVYRGKVKAPKSGRFRFVGLGDDALAVRFNGKTVFDYGWENLSSGQMTGGADKHAVRAALRDDRGKPREFFRYSGAGQDWNENLDGLCSGDVFTVEAGKAYPVEVLVSEIPGGYFGFVLLIEDMDDAPKSRDASGSPIFQLFRTNFALPSTEELYGRMNVPGERRSHVPYDADSLIWRAVL